MMTGAGGDEWLSTSPSWAAYGLRRLDIGLVYHLWRTYLTSYDVKPLPMLKNLVWRYGLGEMSRKFAVKAVSRAAPRRTSAVKRRRFLEAKPAWLAPEPGLARMLEEEAASLAPPGDPRVRFVGEALPLFEHPLQAMEREEVFERGRRLGMETFMPFWDVDLVEFLSRVPPRLRNEDHLSKSLVRKTPGAAIPGSRLRPAEENSRGRPLDPPSLRRSAGCLARARRADKPRGAWHCRKCWARIKGK